MEKDLEDYLNGACDGKHFAGMLVTLVKEFIKDKSNYSEDYLGGIKDGINDNFYIDGIFDGLK